jgi:FkbM family methyltransferase
METQTKDYSTKKIFLYGAGSLGRTLYKAIKNKEIGSNIICFLDRNVATRRVEGLEVVNPFSEPIDKTNAVVVVSILNRDVDFIAIKAQLMSVGFEEVASIVEFYPCCADELGDWYWLSGSKDYLHSEEDIQTVGGLWRDEKSRKIFSSVVNARIEDDCELLPEKYPMEDQYFSKDIPLRSYETFIDCGAYDGDTFDEMERHGVKCKYYYAFEPDLSNFAKLSEKMRKYDQRAVLFPCGVYSQTTLLHFAASGSENSAIQSDGNATVPCVAIDDALVNFSLNKWGSKIMLKMDIEGAELEALKGAEKLIKQADVDLAICLYHKPQDILEIPKLISTFGSYNYYLRLYGYHGMELVMYAIKKP